MVPYYDGRNKDQNKRVSSNTTEGQTLAVATERSEV